ncbi:MULTISPECIES: glutathione peroxidase [Sodalis]|jgi:glutathione peroxidase|uniref:Thioredoxin/glutathione peroxidase BtuE n=1 Tax=Sodalis ligni TaxID=2697027 RepID=A0A4R1N7X4_9GAMM|nr:glutathione peroxidase [Sodalis ligni]TCL02687.1 glutathione peroxidase [Sodalis ligni]
MSDKLYSLPLKTITGETTTLENFKGSVLLIVNVASKCGLTDQYEALESLYKEKHQHGFEVLGFPSNEFAGQEPGSDDEILAFCRGTFGVEFPMFSKIEVNGEHRHPLYQALIAAQPKAVTPQGSGFFERLAGKGRTPKHPQDILWNFEKFLVSRDGQVLQRFAPDMKPDDPIILEAINGALAK